MASPIPSDFKKLNHDNYLQWKHNALSVLANNKILKYVERTLEEISQEDANDVRVQKTIEHRDVTDQTILNNIVAFFIKKKSEESLLDEKRALAQLNLMCSSGVQHHIRQERHARQCWLKLEEVFTKNRGSKWTTRIALIRNPITNDDFEAHIAKMQNLFDQLKEVDQHADEDDFIAALLVSLEPRHKVIQSHLLMQKDLSLNDILTAFRRYQASQKSSTLLQLPSKSPQRTEGNQASSSSSQKIDAVMFSKTKDDKPKSNKTCRYCHKKGHLI